MPYTPFHMGPAMVVKTGLQRRFSLVVFGWSQVVIDLQVLIVLLLGRGILHGVTHTYVGAVILGVFSAWTGKPFAEWFLKKCRVRDFDGRPFAVSWPVAYFSGLVGTFSHVVLDSLVCWDMMPWWPFAAENLLLGAVPAGVVYALCMLAGIVGLAGYALSCSLRERPSEGKMGVGRKDLDNVELGRP